MMWPELPASLEGIQGPITVEVVEHLQAGEPDDIGQWLPAHRTIEVLGSLPPMVAWSILWHEWTHAALGDTGVEYCLTSDMQEAVCTAIATAQLAAMRENLTLAENQEKLYRVSPI
jgi:hypothetical protein